MTGSVAFREVAHAAQRRQLTVMFCDLVDSTPMAVRLDPEEMTDVYRVFRDCAATIIEAADGFVAQFMGDGLLAYFGFPLAHEDDAERAIHAALAVAAAVPQLRFGQEKPLAARFGIATGLVVVGDLIGVKAAEQRSVVGATPNFAARLQAAAGQNEILVSNTTRRLAAGLFDCENLGPLPLKGLNLAEPVWRVVGAKMTADRFRARQAITRSPMVGRDAELQDVVGHWRACLEGHGQIVGVVGDPGIGKSRLVDEFHRKVAAREPHIWLEGAGTQLFRNTPFYAVAQTIQRRLGGGRSLSQKERRSRLESSLKSVGAYSVESLALIGELVDASSPDGAAASALPSDQRRRALIDALVEWLLNSAKQWPTILLIEDIQWVDPSTLEFLQTLAERAPNHRLMVLYTSRPDAPPPTLPGEFHSRVVLGRLDRESARNLVIAAAPGPLAADLLERIVLRADGVPLFAEELARLVGDDPARGADYSIPSALSDLLMARLDQLGPAKELAQIAAVLGSEISLPLLGAVAGLEDQALREGLDTLVAAEILTARNLGGETTYTFRHALIETAAYETLLRRIRRTLHKRAALAMVEHFAGTAEQRPEVLAQHWLRAGEQREAVSAWRRAADRARKLSAFREAQRAAEEGIAIIRSLNPSPDLDSDELALQNLLADASQGADGYASPRVLTAMERVKELTGRQGDTRQQLHRAFGEWAALSSQGDYAASAAPAKRYAQLARSSESPPTLGYAQMMVMTSRYRTGDLIGAEEAYQDGLNYFEDPNFARRPGAAAQTFGNAAVVAWLLGRHDEAARRNEHCLEVSRGTGNPYDLAFACDSAATHALLASMPKEAETLALQGIRLSEEHGYSGFASATRILLGRARADLGHPAEGAALMDLSLHGPGQASVRSSMTMYLTWLAEAHDAHGAIELAQATLDEALTVNPQELFFRAETLRVRGDLSRRRGAVESARADYQAAVSLARSIGADVFVRRALASLAGLNRSDVV